VGHHATYGASNPLYAGNALTNGTGNIVVTTPDIPGASTLDLLRVTVSPLEQAPFGTGNYAVAANVIRTSVCSNGVCTFTDTQAALQSYTVAPPAYFPLLTYWQGNLVLGTNADSGNVSAFRIDANTGALTAVGSPVAAGTNPISVTADPRGNFAYAANFNSNDVSAFSINPVTGALTAIGQPVAAGDGPVSVTVDFSGQFAYVANLRSSNLSVFTINATTGALTPAGPRVTAPNFPVSLITTGKIQ
jgi:6-phosphogluconolactonase (cycloisomerase 2 family)